MKYTQFVTCLAVAALCVGCSNESSTPSKLSASGSDSTLAVDSTRYVLLTEPEGASDVIQIREDAGDGDSVIVQGRIGGSTNPWIEGRAAFSIVDRSLRACSDIPGDQCEVPWDYCCETAQLPTSTLLVKVVGESGDLVEADARRLLNVKELSTVVVKGKAQRDDAGNLTVLATGIYVKD